MAEKPPKSRGKKSSGVFREIGIVRNALKTAKNANDRARNLANKMRKREKDALQRNKELESENRKLSARAKQTGKHYLEKRIILLELIIFTINHLQKNGQIQRGKNKNINISSLVRAAQQEGIKKHVLIKAPDMDENLVPDPVAYTTENTIKKEIGAIFRGKITPKESLNE